MPLPGPDTHVVELRVPGLIGTSGESLLDSVSTVDAAGDGIGQIVRPSDRLRRPAPGPVLQALGRSVPRTLEGYLWSRMTSGGAAKATWALLFPFSLANVAHWMLPPVPDGNQVAAAIGTMCRGLLRVAALLLTMLLAAQLAVVSLDLLAAQCLAPSSTATCLSSVPRWLREIAPLRTAVGVVPVALLVLVLYLVSSSRWTVTTASMPTGEGSRAQGFPGDNLADGAHTAMLRCLHCVAALACVALMLLDGPVDAPETAAEAGAWAVALALLGIAVLGTLLRAHRVIDRMARGLLLVVASGVLAAAAVLRSPLPATLPGTDATVEGIAAALIVVCVLFGLLLVPAALLARPSWSALPHRLRPWAGGFLAAPALVLAALLGGGFGAGVAIALRRLLSDDLRLPAGYTLITLLWGAALAVAGLLALLGFAVAVPLRRRRRGVPAVVKLMGTPQRHQPDAARAWARSSWERKFLHRIVLALVAAMVAGAAWLVAVRLGLGSVPEWLDPLSAFGVLALGTFAAGLLRQVYTAATGSNRARHLGAFADLVCFWPREAHPAVPPSYAIKVVPEVAERAKKHLAEPGARVVLAGYHVGGLLALVAAGRLAVTLPEAERARLGVLTAGTPLQWGYQRAFPAVFPHASLAHLYGQLDGRWRGLCRGTDTFGGGATTWRHQVAEDKLLGIGYCENGTVGAIEPAEAGPGGVLVLGGDHWLADPAHGPACGRRWVPGIRRHNDYVADPEWDRAVGMAAGLEGVENPDPPAGLAEQVALFGDLIGPPRRPADVDNGS